MFYSVRGNYWGASQEAFVFCFGRSASASKATFYNFMCERQISLYFILFPQGKFLFYFKDTSDL